MANDVDRLKAVQKVKAIEEAREAINVLTNALLNAKDGKSKRIFTEQIARKKSEIRQLGGAI